MGQEPFAARPGAARIITNAQFTRRLKQTTVTSITDCVPEFAGDLPEAEQSDCVNSFLVSCSEPLAIRPFITGPQRVVISIRVLAAPRYTQGNQMRRRGAGRRDGFNKRWPPTGTLIRR